jgi:uncharacterized membrane protein
VAGIGFELKKVVRRGDLSSYLQAALSGAMVVAGPWLVTIAAIGFIQSFMHAAVRENPELFLVSIVYSYTGSLLVFGGPHYLFSRIISDFLYEKKEGACLYYLFWFSCVIGVLSVCIGAGALVLPVSGLGRPLVFRLSLVALFVSVSLHWVFLVYVSLLKRYGMVFLAYAAGMGFSLGLSCLLSPALGIGGTLLGFAGGNLFIVGFLLVLILRASPENSGADSPNPGFLAAGRFVAEALGRNVWLFLTGALYYWSIWADKVVFWIFRGAAMGNTPLRLYPDYDKIVYYASLTMIPGLVFFVVFTETDFYTVLRKFLDGLERKPYRLVMTMKHRVASVTARAVGDLAVFQGVAAGTPALLAPFLLRGVPLPAASTPYLLFGAVFLHVLFFALMSFLFFTESYKEAFFGVLLFFIVNTGGVFLSIISDLPPGLSYCIAAGAGTAYDGTVLFSSLRGLEQKIYSRTSEEG